MKVEIDIAKIRRNIEKAKCLSSTSISLMFKDFYEDIFSRLGDVGCRIFSKNIPDSVCYSLFNASKEHRGCFVTTYGDYIFNRTVNHIKEFYIPINASDEREGLCIEDTVKLCKKIKGHDESVIIYGAITAGCLNEKHPTKEEMQEIWDNVFPYVKALSIGGSFWLAKDELPNYVGDIRIGEYMLFGTIPYDSNESLLGECAIKIKAKVIGVYPDRKQVIIDCGYALADIKDCTLTRQGLKYIDSSSEYSIFEAGEEVKFGEEIEIIPNYKSLVKLKDAQRNYI